MYVNQLLVVPKRVIKSSPVWSVDRPCVRDRCSHGINTYVNIDIVQHSLLAIHRQADHMVTRYSCFLFYSLFTLCSTRHSMMCGCVIKDNKQDLCACSLFSILYYACLVPTIYLLYCTLCGTEWVCDNDT